MPNHVPNQEINHDIKLRFDAALGALNPAMMSTARESLWQDIVSHYGEPHRAYHTLDHLKQLFWHFNHLQSQLNEPHLIALALIYHDVIYDPKRDDNEVKSADYAIDKLGAYLSEAHCARIYDLILITANHQLKENNDTDAAYLLDMDLSVLGADPLTYTQYAQAVRVEYAHIGNKDYRTGRLAVLEKLLAHLPLYLTPEFASLEPQARENIKREIKSLQSQ